MALFFSRRRKNCLAAPPLLGIAMEFPVLLLSWITLCRHNLHET